ncbi:MAG: ABC transporter substrate-binding protein [Angelakisella sp.]
MKKLTFVSRTLTALTLCAALLLSGCASTTPPSDIPQTPARTDTAAPQEGGKLKVGIIQFMDHPSLNEIRDSFVTELAALGYDESKVTVSLQNGQGDFSNLNSIAQKFVGEKMDLIVAIATPAAQAAAAATTEIPVLFSAVTDPVAAGLTADLTAPGGNVTGTSDAIPVNSIFELAARLTPNVKKFGFIYNSGEVNSISVITAAKAYCDANGLTYAEGTVTNSGEVQQTGLQLLSECDALFAPIDNTVASAMPNLAAIATQQKKPVYVAADSMVADGGLATVGINYKSLGKETAAMAKELLEGKKPAELPVRTLREFAEVINEEQLTALGLKK